MSRRIIMSLMLFLPAALFFLNTRRRGGAILASMDAAARTEGGAVGRVIKSDEEWRRILTPEQYHILRQKGTERAFSGKYHDSKGKGIYQCAACQLDLFSSDTKFDSGTGWPSFWKPIDETHIRKQEDKGFFSTRTEVLCARCDGHLGHVFDDGPPPTGLRYCMNSAALEFVPEGKAEESGKS